MSVVVSDSSPLICLSFLGQHDLLHILFGAVFVPPAVAAEIERPRRAFAGARIEQFMSAEVRSPSDVRSIAQANPELHKGEIDDEAQGRNAAQRLGISTIGTLGVLSRAKQAGKISQVRPMLDRLRSELNFFISDVLYDSIVERVGE